MISNTAISLFILEIEFARPETRCDGAESVPVSEALSHTGTLEVSYHSLTRVLLPSLELWKAKDIQAIEAVKRTFTYKHH